MWYLFGIIKLEGSTETPQTLRVCCAHWQSQMLAVNCVGGGFTDAPLQTVSFQEIAIVAQELPVWDNQWYKPQNGVEGEMLSHSANSSSLLRGPAKLDLDAALPMEGGKSKLGFDAQQNRRFCGVEWTRAPLIGESQKADLLQKLLIHQKTLEKIMERTFVLPIKFGCVVDSAQEIQGILKRGYPFFCQAIGELNGKIEINLTVTWDVSEQLKTIAGTDLKIKTMKEEANRGGNKELLLSIGKTLEEKLAELRRKLTTQILERLDGHHEARLDHECLEERMVLNSSFLVFREKEESFLALVIECDQDLQGELDFKCLMPLPPHSFRTIAIQKVSPSILQEAMKLFEVGSETTLEELKEKNRQLIQRFHPDVKPGSKEETFSLIHQSFGLLKELCENCQRQGRVEGTASQSFASTRSKTDRFCGVQRRAPIIEEKPFANMNPHHCFLIRSIEGDIHDS